MESLMDRLKLHTENVLMGIDRAGREEVSAGFTIPTHRISDGMRDSAFDRAAAEPPLRPIPEKPSIAMLRAMESPELGGDARQQLAVQVEDLLGYTPLRKDAGAPSRLQRVLAELEIEAFEQKSVDDYKGKMQAHFQAVADTRDKERIFATSEELASMNLPAGVRFESWQLRMLMGGVGLPRPYYQTEVEWCAVPLQKYAKPVPEHVLRKAMQIKQREPDAKFFVDELREEQRTLDPFLIVQIGEDQAAIEVWDEPEFEKTL